MKNFGAVIFYPHNFRKTVHLMRLDTRNIGKSLLSKCLAKLSAFRLTSRVGIEHRRHQNVIIFIQSGKGFSKGRNADCRKVIFTAHVFYNVAYRIKYNGCIYLVFAALTTDLILLVGIIDKFSVSVISRQLASCCSNIKTANYHNYTSMLTTSYPR